MNPLGKKLRIASGIVILINVLAIFFPFYIAEPENYTPVHFTELNYMNFGMEADPFSGSASGVRLVWVICFVMVPVMLSVIIGIFSIVKGEKQKISSLAPISVVIIYIVSPAVLKMLQEEGNHSWGFGLYVHVISSLIALILGALSIVLKSDSVQEELTIAPIIPGIQEIKQEHIEAKYNIIETEDSAMITQKSPGVSGSPRGVMLGLSGLYAGAEIPITDGERIKLGRVNTNDLIFEGQEKISRNHCYIKWDAKEQVFYICDYSSNGTFINGSEDCIPQNLEIAVEPGTILAIGDEQNTFRLE